MFKRKVKLDCYTHVPDLIKMQPLKPGAKPPSWWSKIKSTYKVYESKKGMHVTAPTVKTCPGVVEYIRKPINFNLWTDLDIIVTPDGRIKSSGPGNTVSGLDRVETHDIKQYHADLYGDVVVAKLVSPWVITSEDETDFLLTETHYSPELRRLGIGIIPGVVNFKYQHSMNIFLILPIKEEEYEIKLKYDTPIASLFPMTEREVEIYMHEADEVFMNRLVGKFPSITSGRYYAYKRMFKKKG
jgi:hypothetical protein